MRESFDNAWLVDVLKRHRWRSEEENVVALLDSSADHALSIVKTIRASARTKAFVPVPSRFRTGYADKQVMISTIKRALWVAETVIIVPAPLFPTCHILGLRFREFSDMTYEPLAGGQIASMPVELLRWICGLLGPEIKLVESGAVTFLPFLGGNFRVIWGHESLEMPAVPVPYIPRPREPWQEKDLCALGVYSLLMERLAAIQLGALHINGFSFPAPVAYDFELRDLIPGAHLNTALEIDISSLCRLTFSEILAVREHCCEEFGQFSAVVAGPARMNHSDAQAFAAMLTERLRAIVVRAASAISATEKELRTSGTKMKMTTAKLAAKSAAFVVGTAGLLGHATPFSSFLVGGGILWDLVDLVTTYRQHVALRAESLYTAVGKLRKQ